jgi:hypothetical protein
MSTELKIINPLDYPAWDDLVLSSQGYSFFHSSSWARVLRESYGYNPLYFTQVDDGRLLALIPVMEVKSFLTGHRGVSLPFSDYCEPLIADSSLFRDVFSRLVEYGSGSGWKFVELRGGDDYIWDFPCAQYVVHSLELRDEVQTFLNFRSSTKRNIKKAIRSGVKANVCRSEESVSEFYRLNCITRKEHGLPPQPYNFFKKIYGHVISGGGGVVVLASYNGTNIAGAVYFHLGDKAIYKYGASDKAYQHLRANNMVMWEAIKWYCRHGYRSFCLGRTDPENRGLMQFKSGWGTSERVIRYYKYDLKKETFISSSPRTTGLHNRVFERTQTHGIGRGWGDGK